ncbi:MAG: hypothetical protein AAGG57_21025 [Pseudomonadota bacterium]
MASSGLPWYSTAEHRRINATDPVDVFASRDNAIAEEAIRRIAALYAV